MQNHKTLSVATVCNVVTVTVIMFDSVMHMYWFLIRIVT